MPKKYTVFSSDFKLERHRVRSHCAACIRLYKDLSHVVINKVVFLDIFSRRQKFATLWTRRHNVD